MAGARIEATMMLCDSVQSVAGKLFVLGGGWNVLQTRTPAAMGLAVKLEIADELAGQQLPLVAKLVTPSGELVSDEETAIHFTAELEFARRPGKMPDAPLGGVFALNAHFRGLHLEPGNYAWELLIDGDLVARSLFYVV